ncbi:MAG: ABC transporter permease [Gemmataceae bacterium]
MLRDAWFLSQTGFRLLIREREVLFWAFGMPLVFFYFIGTITGGSQNDGEQKDDLGVLVSSDAGFLADELIKRLDVHYDIERVDTPQKLGNYSRQLTIPSNFTQMVLAGKQAKIEMQHPGGGISGDYDDFRVNRAVYTLLADLILLTKDGDAATPERFAEPRVRKLKIERESAGKFKDPPKKFQQSVPGTMVFLVLLVVATTGAGLVMDREQGLLRRLASSPMSRSAVVAGKWGSRVLLSLLQIAFAVIVGALVFDVRWGPHYFMLALILMAYVSLGSCLGLLLGNYCRTQGQVIAIGVIASNIMAALGGCWWPAEITPKWCQTVALALPTGWVMDALHQLVSFGAEPTAVIPHLIALVGSALLAGWWLSKSFRFI